jgi:hypothetical protein
VEEKEMAELNTGSPTLVDIGKAEDAAGNIQTIVKMLHQTNEVLDVLPFVECNDGTTHLTTVETGLPEPTWRGLYEGIQPTKFTSVQVRESTGSLENFANVDKDLIERNSNVPGYRLQATRRFIEGMNQEFVQTLIYGNEGTAPKEFTGLSARFNSLSAANADNIIDAQGNDDDLTSIWLCVFGDETGHALYPRGFTGGLVHTDLGIETVDKPAAEGGGSYRAYRDHFEWKCGFSLRDWRYFVRIANIDLSLLTKDASSGPDLLDLMTQALELPPSLSMGTACFLVSRTIRSWLRRQVLNKVASSTLTMDEVLGRRVVTMDGVPVYRVDQILHTEDRVV